MAKPKHFDICINENCNRKACVDRRNPPKRSTLKMKIIAELRCLQANMNVAEYPDGGHYALECFERRIRELVGFPRGISERD